MYFSEQFSPFLYCKGVEFKVHRLILCRASTFFAAVCSGSWKVRNEVPPSFLIQPQTLIKYDSGNQRKPGYTART